MSKRGRKKKRNPVRLVSPEFTPIPESRELDPRRLALLPWNHCYRRSCYRKNTKIRYKKKKKICVVRAVSGRVDSSLYTRFHFSFSVVRVSVTLSSRFFVFSLSKNMYSWHFFFLARWRCPSVPVVRISVYRTLRACVTQVSIRKSFSRVWNQHFCPWQCCRCSLLFFFPYSLRCTK